MIEAVHKKTKLSFPWKCYITSLTMYLRMVFPFLLLKIWNYYFQYQLISWSTVVNFTALKKEVLTSKMTLMVMSFFSLSNLSYVIKNQPTIQEDQYLFQEMFIFLFAIGYVVAVILLVLLLSFICCNRLRDEIRSTTSSPIDGDDDNQESNNNVNIWNRKLLIFEQRFE